MLLFLGGAAALWTLGWIMKTPMQARWITIALLYVGILMALVILPEGAPLRLVLGGTLGQWLVVGGLVGVILLYSAGLKALRKRVRPENQAGAADWEPGKRTDMDPNAPLTENELDRYMRQLILREVGGAGQRKLKASRVLVVGAGGLGSPVLQYLAAAGVGTIGVIDDDVVDISNLHRQVVHNEDRLGMPKVFSAQQALHDLNPYVVVRPYNRRLTDEIAQDLVADHDLVLDGTDNFDTRYLVNRACVATGVPLLSGAITQWEGQLSLFDPSKGAPCYQCIFPEAPADGLAPTCAEAGVIGPLPGVVGSMMAVEAIKYLSGAGETPLGQMVIYDGLFGESRKIRLKPREGCPVCGYTRG
ncbi:MAG: HesA/MoeB/ThiF family protein [Pseudomonadota bacterium]